MLELHSFTPFLFLFSRKALTFYPQKFPSPHHPKEKRPRVLENLNHLSKREKKKELKKQKNTYDHYARFPGKKLF